jgi:hypothetical protein
MAFGWRPITALIDFSLAAAEIQIFELPWRKIHLGGGDTT